LDKIKVVFDIGNEAEETQINLALREARAVEAEAAQKYPLPLERREARALVADLVQAAGIHLDRVEAVDREREYAPADDVLGDVGDLDLRPAPAKKKPGIARHQLVGDRRVRDAELHQLGPVAVLFRGK